MTAHEALTTPHPVRLSVGDFMMLNDAGAFADYGKSELINGTIYVVNAQYRPHARAKSRLHIALAAALDAFSDLEAVVEGAIDIPPDNVPEPDILVTDQAEGDGLIPLASVKLAIEIADTSLANDLGEKAQLYAANAIPEYWVVDLKGKVVHQLWSPGAAGYGERRESALGETLTSQTIAGLSVDTSGV